MSLVDSGLDKFFTEVSRRRVRLVSAFQDFDRLRSGNITKDQFRRGLSSTSLGTSLTAEELEAVIAAFPGSHPSQFSYTKFCSAVDCRNPEVAVMEPKKLSPELEAGLQELMKHFVHQVSVKGLELSYFFKDHDRHNTGKITATQFHRCFPFKVDPKFLKAIIEKYCFGEEVSYIQWCRDVMKAKAAQEERDKKSASEGPGKVAIVRERPVISVNSLIDGIEVQVLKNRIRLQEPFRDFDHMRSGFVTEAQFKAIIGGTKFVNYRLTDEELGALASNYLLVDDQGTHKCRYTEFLADVDPAFRKPGEEKRRGELICPTSPARAKPNEQASHIEKRVQVILDRVRANVRTRRIDLKPLFQDFDRAVKGIYQTRTCTRTRFERVLAVVKVQLTPDEMHLIEARYATKPGQMSSEADLINYLVFCNEIEEPDNNVAPDRIAAAPSAVRSDKFRRPGKSSGTTLADLLDDIAVQCRRRSIRLSEFLQDFDQLRTGTVQRDKLSSGLSISGLALPKEEVDEICEHYAVPGKPDYVNWKTFVADVDHRSGTQGAVKAKGPSMEQTMGLRQADTAKAAVPTGVDASQLAVILQRIHDTVKARGILLPPFFHDYDRHNVSRITATQFRQVLSRHRFSVSEADIDCLVKTFTDPRDEGRINYRLFIAAVDDSENNAKNSADREQARGAIKSEATKPPPADLKAVMELIRSKVAKGARISEFFHDGDKLRKGNVTLCRFRSCLAMLGLPLGEAEFDALNYYQREDGNVDYVHFVRDVNDLVDAGSPRREAKRAAAANPLVAQALKKVTDVVSTRRLQIKPLFADYDRLRKGVVTRAQFLSALSQVNVQTMTQVEREALLDFFMTGNGAEYGDFCKLVDPSV